MNNKCKVQDCELHSMFEDICTLPVEKIERACLHPEKRENYKED